MVVVGISLSNSAKSFKSISASNSNETDLDSSENSTTVNTTVTKGHKRRISLHQLNRNSSNSSVDKWPSVMPTSCLDGWIAYNQSCFFVGGTPKTWSVAQLECNAYGGSLWVVNNLKEWDTITAYAAKSAFNWIGLSWPVDKFNATWADQNTPDNSTVPIPMAIELLPWLVPTGTHGYTPNLACVAVYAYPDSTTSLYVAYRSCASPSNYICKGPSANVAGHSLVANPPRNETIV